MARAKRKPKSRQAREAIVCGTDFSERAREAGNVAAGLARALGLPVLLVHVVQAEYRRSTRSERSHPAVRELRREAGRLRRRGVQVVEELREGKADEVLARLSHERSIRLVIVGSLGTRQERLWRLGSVSERTAQTSSAPTLVVRSETPFEAWFRNERPLRVFVAFDFTVAAESAVEWVRKLGDAGPCDVTVAYTNWPPEALERLGVPHHYDEAAVENLPLVQQSLERDLRERIALLLGGVDAQVKVRPSAGDVSYTIINLASDAQADLIVTGTRQVRGIGRAWQTSVSRSLLHYARASVACVPVVLDTQRVQGIPAIRRVLVTTDLSTPGNRAIAHAVAITQPGGTVRLLHVAHPRAIAGGQYEKGLRTTSRHTNYVQALGRQLQQLLPAEAEAHGISVEAHVLECEDTAKGICQEAERFGADAIVIGSKRPSGLGRFALGSVAQSVMTRSKRPVFVVRLPDR